MQNTHEDSLAGVDILLSAHTHFRRAVMLHGKHTGVCYVGRVECLFPSTRGWTALNTNIHTWTHMVFKAKGGTYWVKGEQRWRGPHDNKYSLLFWFKETFFTQWERRDCLPPPFCHPYFLHAGKMSSHQVRSMIHTCTHTPTRDIFV